MFIFLKKNFPLFLIVLVGIGVYLYKQKDNYLKSDDIKVVQFADLSGFNAKRTEKFDLGIEAYFKSVNENGGINGRKITFIKVDNKGEKDLFLNKIYELKNDIISFFGFVDFCSSKRVLEMLANENKPFLMPFCAADFLKDSYESFYHNITPSIEDEIDTLLDYLEKEGIRSFSVLYEDDICMRSLVKRVESFAKEKRMEIEEIFSYKKNTYLFSDIYKKLAESSPKAVLILGSFKEVGSFFRRVLRSEDFLETIFLTPSYIGIDAFLEDLKDGEGLNLIFSQPIFSPLSDKRIVKEYKSIFKKYYPKEEVGFDSLKGFLYAKIFSLGIEEIEKELSGKKILNSLKNIPYIKYNRENLIKILNKNGMLNKVYLFEYKDQRIFTINQER